MLPSSSQILAPNVLIAVLGAVGVLALFLAFAIRQGAELRQADLAAGRVREISGTIDRLQERIDQAGLLITAGEFLRVVLFVGVGGGLVFYLLMAVPAGFLLGLLAGVVGYWSFLGEKRDRHRQKYQSAAGGGGRPAQGGVSNRQRPTGGRRPRRPVRPDHRDRGLSAPGSPAPDRNAWPRKPCGRWPTAAATRSLTSSSRP